MGLEDFCPTGPGQDFSRDCIQLSYNILRGVKSQVGNQEWRVHENWLISGQPNFVTSIPEYQASAFRLLTKLDFFRSFLMNVCKVFNVDLLLFVMKPVELISKQFTVVECSVMSVTKGAYFLLFSLCRWSMLDVNGTVSSKMLSLFFTGSMMTTSGLRFVKQSSDGMVPPPVASQPGRSL